MAPLSFVTDDRGQDLMEYTLVIAFAALALASLMMSAQALGFFAGFWTGTR